MAQPWWMRDRYYDDTAIPPHLAVQAGPQGIALVRAYANGKTDPGWGGDTFMHNYTNRQFKNGPVLKGYEAGKWTFAFVMRSMKMVCIDIDGKNGGFLHAGKLGMLPHTLAETSKSGDGYHLYYLTDDDEWDDDFGYAEFADRISLEQGVDLRATGCVFHHPQQRWNDREIAVLPEHLKTRLHTKIMKAAESSAAIVKVLEGEDGVEIALMQDSMIDDLKKPIPPGRRNNTLFAIGTQMYTAQVPNWIGLLEQRALDVGLDAVEAQKLIANVKKYGDKQAATP